MVRLLPAVLLGLAGVTGGTQVVDGEQGALARVLSAYHAALQDGEAQTAVKLLGPSLFMADERSSGESERLSAHLYLTGGESTVLAGFVSA